MDRLLELPQPVKFAINGLFATGVHFAVLMVNIELFAFTSAGLANLVAAVFGITASFIGSRYFVFQSEQAPLLGQFTKFVLLYAAIAVLHGFVMMLWADWQGWDYRIGFVVATVVQLVCSFLGNKFLVFKATSD